MNRMTRAMLAAASMSLVLAGCVGSSDDPEPTAQDKWATSLCEGLAPTTAAIEPPSTDAADVAETKAAILDFLRTIRERLDSQAQVLADAGAPPEVDAAAYDAAQQSLADGSATLSDVIKRLKKADPQDATQMQDSLLQVSESLAGSATYQGPLAELSASDKSLEKAFENSKECTAIMS